MATGRFQDWVRHQHEIGSWRIIIAGLQWTIIDIFRYGLKILNNLQLESQTEVKAQTCKGTKEYVCFIGTFAQIRIYLQLPLQLALHRYQCWRIHKGLGQRKLTDCILRLLSLEITEIYISNQ